ncbi:MAG: zf-TFIIB domain-containing protein [Akkermansiaceae bacterium]|nr:zf-TFIIB domain-containing protein [Akkermansiaceae bacterium]
MRSKDSCLGGAEPEGFGDVFFESGGVVFFQCTKCEGVFVNRQEVFFDREDHAVAHLVFFQLFFQGWREGGEGGPVRVVDEIKKPCFDENLIRDPAGFGGYECFFKGGCVGSFEERADKSVPLCLILGKNGDREKEGKEKVFHGF